MHTTKTLILGEISPYPPTPRNLTQPVAKNVRTANGKAEPDPRLWKLTSTAYSPLRQQIETGLILFISASGIGVTAYCLGQVFSFFHNDAFLQTVTSLLH
jgi:hypothetical protein